MAQSPVSSSPPAAGSAQPTSLDLSMLPPVFVLPTRLELEDLHDLEDMLVEQGAPLTYDITEAKLVLGKVGMKRRAEMELRCRRLWTDEVTHKPSKRKADVALSPSTSKRRKHGDVSSGLRNGAPVVVVDDSATESENEAGAGAQPEAIPLSSSQDGSHTPPEGSSTADLPFTADDFLDVVKVVKLEWYEDSVKAGKVLPLDEYIVYEGRPKDRPADAVTPQPAKSSPTQSTPHLTPASQRTSADRPHLAKSILERAQADASTPTLKHGISHYGQAHRSPRRFGAQGTKSTSHAGDHASTPKTHLLQQTTSEYEGVSSDIPEMPDWVKEHRKYACERSTPANPPNDAFITELKKIKLARLLTNDEIGVRAYSTSIASLAAYPYAITNPREILALPGCDTKTANLWIEWKNNDGVIEAAREFEADETMQVLRLFYDIWGVGAATAREFYYDRGWRDLDDVVEYGWSTLSRVQQIGVKYYDEFLQRIPRREVESIAGKVREHAVKVRDEGVEVLVVGGYRRGKEEAGDVDLIVSHRALAQTANLVADIVASLETEGWVTHTLLLSLTGTNRGQSTLPFRASGGGGHGFDTLDKALVVWQDPSWPRREADLAADPKARNPNVHRRVDIIVAPWRTVGCAVAGWSGGTTFQRDLRRYAKNVRGWKFDSSGVRDRSTGAVVELEGPEGVREGGMVEAERKVFEGMGLAYREPWERCTG